MTSTPVAAGLHMKTIVRTVAFAALLLGMCDPLPAEPLIDFYFGQQFTENSDIRFKQHSLGNDFTFHDVSLDSQSFVSPFYWGLRGVYYFERVPWLGVGVEYIHMKAFAETSDVRRLTGIRSGAPVDTRLPMNTVVQGFSVSHGLNYVLFNGYLRHGFYKDPDRFPAGRVQPYGGVGVGPVIVHPENSVEHLDNGGGYDLGGAGGQVCLGVRLLLLKHLGVFAEYKFTFSGLEVNVAHGSAEFDERSHHLIGGLTVALPSPW